MAEIDRIFLNNLWRMGDRGEQIKRALDETARGGNELSVRRQTSEPGQERIPGRPKR